MQTFLPYPDFRQSAACLDDKRLRAQTWEARQIYYALDQRSHAWKNHCITRLWEGYLSNLGGFWCACSDECVKRNFKGYARFKGYAPVDDSIEINFKIPNTFHHTPDNLFDRYKSHLLSKNFPFYGKYGWNVPVASGYWGMTKNKEFKLYSLPSVTDSVTEIVALG